MNPLLTTPITVLEELVLLTHDSETGQFFPIGRKVFDCAAAAAVLMDLTLRGRLDNDLHHLFVVDPEPVNDDLLDPILQVISLAPVLEPAPLSSWLNTLADEGEALRVKALRRLEKNGILKHESKKILWIFAGDSYPILHTREVREVKGRLKDVILKDEIPLPHDIMLTALAQACGLFSFLLDSREMKAALPRIEQVAKMDLIGQAVAKAICATDVAVAMVSSVH